MVGIIRHAFEHQRGRAVGERAVDDIAVARDPADVGGTPIDFAGPVIEHLRMGHRRPEQIAARAVENALGGAGRAGGVEDEQRVFRAHRFGRAIQRGGIAGWAVEEVTTLHHRHIRAGALDDENGFDRGTMGERRIDIGLQGHSLTTAQPFVGGDDQAGVAVANAAGEAVGRESAEHDRMDRADAGAGQHGEGGFGDHRQIERHPVAATDPLCFQHIGEAADFLVELCIGDDPAFTRIIAFPDDRGLVAALGQMPVYAVGRDVELAVGEPADAEIGFIEAAVIDLRKGGDPVEPLRLIAPEGVGIGQRLRMHPGGVRGSDPRIGGEGRGNGIEGFAHGFGLSKLFRTSVTKPGPCGILDQSWRDLRPWSALSSPCPDPHDASMAGSPHPFAERGDRRGEDE